MDKSRAKRKKIVNAVSSEEMKQAPESSQKSSDIRCPMQTRALVIGLPSFGKDGLKFTNGSNKQLKSCNKNLGKRSNLDDSNRKPVVVGTLKSNTRKKEEKRMDNEYSRIRRNLSYLLNRISYEQSLIDAYSSEGWKGLSLEKLKPDKELQRATREIFLRKVKIRDLFKHLDAIAAEGKLPESLFDSEGKISGDDIFCAECGSKDVSADNDIILCDGACDRGFHQFCLEPPLLNENIPPDDESWLCPGCNCKVECIDMLNDTHGTNILITDSWEKVFPEAAAAGCENDPNDGLPSDDSEDDDYDPDGLEDDKGHNNDNDGGGGGGDDDEEEEEENEENESSDESDFSSASDEMVPLPKDEQYLGLPSDDSEDDDYNPGALSSDDKDIQKSPTSGCDNDPNDGIPSDDSEDDDYDPDGLEDDKGHNNDNDGGGGGDDDDDKENEENESSDSMSDQNDEVSLDGESGDRESRLQGRNTQAVDDQEVSSAVPERRGVERLDYKKLYDEAYGNVSSSSCDDEDFTASESDDDADNENGKASKIQKKSHVENQHAQRTKGGRQKDGSPSHKPSEAGTQVPVSGGLPHNKQRLFQAFQENRYPDKGTKESLATELEMTYKQVDSWFRNTRWSVNHSSTRNGTIVKTISKKDFMVPKINNELRKAATEPIETDSKRTESPDETTAAGSSGGSSVPKSSHQKSPATKSRKRKR